jgi:hypothetical protein
MSPPTDLSHLIPEQHRDFAAFGVWPVTCEGVPAHVYRMVVRGGPSLEEFSTDVMCLVADIPADYTDTDMLSGVAKTLLHYWRPAPRGRSLCAWRQCYAAMVACARLNERNDDVLALIDGLEQDIAEAADVKEYTGPLLPLALGDLTGGEEGEE